MHLPRPLQRSLSAPLLLLLAALSTVFVFGNDRGRFYRPGHHDWVSAEHLSIAVNFSPEHRFLMFRSQRDAGGPDGPRYDPYNRFPVGGYALIALATSPFRGDLSARLHAARVLMLGFFAAAAVLAYLSMSRLAASRWVALTAVLLPFSSFYGLYYNDMIHPEVIPGLFGVLLAFHGVVVFLQDGRFPQLLVKACAGLALAWHVLALVAVFVVLALLPRIFARVALLAGARTALARITRVFARVPLAGARAALARITRIFARVSPPRVSPQSRRFMAMPRVFARVAPPRPRHCLTLGVVMLVLFAPLLTFNLVNEYTAYGGTTAWSDLPSVNSLQYRTGFDPAFNERYARFLAWRVFLEEEFRRIGTLSVPWFFSARLLPGFAPGAWLDPPGAVDFGVLMFAGALAVLPFARSPLPVAVLMLSGVAWSLPMRHQTAFHDYYCLYHIGIPLIVFAAAASALRRLAGDRAAAGLAAAALAVFVLSSRDMGGVGRGADEAQHQEALMSDFENIRRMTAGRPVYLPVTAFDPEFGGAEHATAYYLAGSVIYENFDTRPRPCRPGFVVTRERVAGAELLTPNNRLRFLYDRGDYDRNTLQDSASPTSARRARRRTDCSHLGRPSAPPSRLDSTHSARTRTGEASTPGPAPAPPGPF